MSQDGSPKLQKNADKMKNEKTRFFKFSKIAFQFFFGSKIGPKMDHRSRSPPKCLKMDSKWSPRLSKMRRERETRKRETPKCTKMDPKWSPRPSKIRRERELSKYF